MGGNAGFVVTQVVGSPIRLSLDPWTGIGWLIL
jgi:hypothetical protein